MKGTSIFRDSQAENEKRLSELHGLLLSGKLPLREYVCSLLCGRKIVEVMETILFITAFQQVLD